MVLRLLAGLSGQYFPIDRCDGQSGRDRNCSRSVLSIRPPSEDI